MSIVQLVAQIIIKQIHPFPLRRIAQPFPLGYNISITKIERTVYRDGKK